MDAAIRRFDAVAATPAWGARADALLAALDARRLRARGRVGVEVGVWRGDLARAQLRPPSAHTLHLVDPWASSGEPVSRAVELRHANASVHARNRAAVEALRDALPPGRVVLHVNTSLAAAGTFALRSVDYVYLDGDHRREAAARDLEAWWPALAPGGVLVGHDYGPHCLRHRCVRAAADAFAASRRVPLRRLPGQQFLLEPRR